MKIGVVGTIWLNIPPNGYGGTEEVIYNLVNGLVEKGHDVTLFGPKTAQVKAKVIPTVEAPLRDQNVAWTDVTHTLYHLTESFDNASAFDILHVHINKSQDYISLPLALSSKTPVLFTPHFRMPDEKTYKDRYQILTKYNKLPFTSISNSQRKGINLNFVKTVYNSLQIEKFPFSKKAGDYFVWLGKVNPFKGTKEAILAAKYAGVQLKVLGAVDKGVPHMLAYYEEEVKPLIDGKQIQWVGEVSLEEKGKLLGGAKAFLNPILWEEPFGLVMAEAQAVGTPVVSFNRGAAPELIVDGKTGFLVNTIDEMVEKMKAVDSIDRYACRKNIEDNFSVDTMVEGYVEAYNIVQEQWEDILFSQKKEFLGR